MANAAYTKWRHKIDRKMPCHGEIDYKKKLIRVNPKKAKTKPTFKRPVRKHASKYPELFDSMFHEIDHKRHPKKLEKNVRRDARRAAKTMTAKQKRPYYQMFS